MPDIKLTAKQIKFVDTLYYKYIYNKITMGWNQDLAEIEQKEKWPSGPRMKGYEAKRIILNQLVSFQDKKKLTIKEAAIKFYSSLTCRPTYQKMLQYCYNY